MATKINVKPFLKAEDNGCERYITIIHLYRRKTHNPHYSDLDIQLQKTK